MKKTFKILFSFLTIILGWLLLGFGYATKLGYPINGICFYSGFLLMPSGFIILIINLKNINKKTYSQKIRILNFEKQSSNWSVNLYDLCLTNVKSVIRYQYDNKSFGSWFIECKNKQIIYDGKDSLLIIQSIDANNWKNEKVIKKEDLNDSNLLSFLDTM
jgi:hypothetical protein